MLHHAKISIILHFSISKKNERTESKSSDNKSLNRIEIKLRGKWIGVRDRIASRLCFFPPPRLLA